MDVKKIDWYWRQGGGYSAESEAVFAKWASQGVAADSSRKTLVNEMINGMISDGDFTELDGLWIFAAHAKVATYVNLKNPTSTIASINSDVAWVKDVSMTPNGTNAYIDLNWNPSTDAVKFTLNDNTYGIGFLS